MNQEEIIKLAQYYFSHGHNCAEAVLLALKEDLAMSEEELNILGSGFGAGMGTREATCGALIGAGIASNIVSKGQGALMNNKRIVNRFLELSKAVTCKDLKTIINGKPLTPCLECVANAIKAYYEVYHG